MRNRIKIIQNYKVSSLSSVRLHFDTAGKI